MSEFERHETILKYLKLAERSGKRYAFKYSRYEPECIAEAYYILTTIILSESELFMKAENPEIFLKICIARKLTNYFSNRHYTEKVGVTTNDGQIIGNYKEDPNNEISIIDELESVFPYEEEIISLYRNGFDLNDILFVNTGWFKTVKDMLAVEKKLKRSRAAMLKKKAIADEYQPLSSVVNKHGEQVVAA